MVDIGRVCQECVDNWRATYSSVGWDIEYTLVENPLHCEECEGEDSYEKMQEKWNT